MAMRPRTPTFRTQPSTRRVYENFQPKSEMKENPEAYLLHIYLPGFTNERIRITFLGSSRMLKITGERPIEGNRWIRFDQTYALPENCETETLQGKFYLGTLTVTVPKKFISQVAPKPEVKTTQEKSPGPSEKNVAEPNPEKAQETNIPPQSTTSKVEEPIADKKSASLPSPAKGPADLKAQKGTQEDTSAQSPIQSEKPADEKGLRALIPPETSRDRSPQKGQEGTDQRPIITQVTPKETGKPQKVQEEFEPKPTLPMATKKQTDEKPQKGQEEVEPKPTLTTVTRDPADEKRREEIKLGTIIATVKKQLDEKTVGTRAEDAENERVSKKKVKEDGKPSVSRKPKKNMEKGNFKEKEIRARKVSPKEADPSARKAPEKEKESSSRTGNRIRELAASTSQVVTRIAEGKWNDEEKHLVVNMGAAVLVIAALGAYASYWFASSGRT